MQRHKSDITIHQRHRKITRMGCHISFSPSSCVYIRNRGARKTEIEMGNKDSGFFSFPPQRGKESGSFHWTRLKEHILHINNFKPLPKSAWFVQEKRIASNSSMEKWANKSKLQTAPSQALTGLFFGQSSSQRPLKWFHQYRKKDVVTLLGGHCACACGLRKKTSCTFKPLQTANRDE